MAIINQMISVTTQRLESAGGLPGANASGLVITTDEMNETSDPALLEKKTAYDANKAVALTRDEAIALFGDVGESTAEDSDSTVYSKATANFAESYYSYTSPKGYRPAELYFYKAKSGATPKDSYLDVSGQEVNFISFTFLTSAAADETDAWFNSLTEVATENAGNRLFVVNYTSKAASKDDAQLAVTQAKKFKPWGGVMFVYGADTWSGFMPMAIAGAADFVNTGIPNFMYRQFPYEAPGVTDTAISKLLSDNNINFYGLMQSNGRRVLYFQRGYTMDGTDGAVYIGETWFKGACEEAFTTMLIENDTFPANQTGVMMVSSRLATYCQQAVDIGVFNPMEVNDEAKLAIVSILRAAGFEDADPDNIAFLIQRDGYYAYTYLATRDVGDENVAHREKVIAYVVFYGSGESIKKIIGTDIILT